MPNFVHACLADRSATTAIEYALIASLISIGIAGTAALIGQDVRALFDSVATQL